MKEQMDIDSVMTDVKKLATLLGANGLSGAYGLMCMLMLIEELKGVGYSIDETLMPDGTRNFDIYAPKGDCRAHAPTSEDIN